MSKNNILYEDFFDEVSQDELVSHEEIKTDNVYDYTILFTVKIEDVMFLSNEEYIDALNKLVNSLSYMMDKRILMTKNISEPVFLTSSNKVIDIYEYDFIKKNQSVIIIAFSFLPVHIKPKKLIKFFDYIFFKDFIQNDNIYFIDFEIHKYNENVKSYLSTSEKMASLTENRWTLVRKSGTPKKYFKLISKNMLSLSKILCGEDKFRTIHMLFDDPYTTLIFPKGPMNRIPLLDGKIKFNDWKSENVYIMLTSTVEDKIFCMTNYKEYSKAMIRDMDEDKINFNDIENWMIDRSYKAFYIYKSTEWPDMVVYVFDDFYNDETSVSLLSMRQNHKQDQTVEENSILADPNLAEIQKEEIRKVIIYPKNKN